MKQKCIRHHSFGFGDDAHQQIHKVVFPPESFEIFPISEQNFRRLPTVLHFLVDVCLFVLHFVFVLNLQRISTAASSASCWDSSLDSPGSPSVTNVSFFFSLSNDVCGSGGKPAVGDNERETRTRRRRCRSSSSRGWRLF